MLNLNTFNNLVDLAQNTALDGDTRITIASQNARTGATFGTTSTNVFTRLAERAFRTDEAKVSYRDVRAQLLRTVADLFGVKEENHLPGPVRAAFVYGETSCDRPLTARRLKAVLTATAKTLGYSGLADMRQGVAVRNAFHLHVFDTQEEFDEMRDRALTELDNDHASPADDEQLRWLDGALKENEITAEQHAQLEDLVTHGTLLSYYKTGSDAQRVEQDIQERRTSDLTMKFERILRDPAKASKAVKLIYADGYLKHYGGSTSNPLTSLIEDIHAGIRNELKHGSDAVVAKNAKFLAQLADYDRNDGRSIHKLLQSYGHRNYIDGEAKGFDYVDTIYKDMMKSVAANIKARVDRENLSAAEKKRLVADMTNVMMQLNPCGEDFEALAEKEPSEDRRIALDNLLNVARLKPNFKVDASVDILTEMSSQASLGEDSNRFGEAMREMNEELLDKEIAECEAEIAAGHST